MQSVEILIYEGADELDVVAPFEILAAAGMEVDLVCDGPSAPIRCAHGLELRPTAELGRPDVLVVPGGNWISRAAQGAWAEARRGELPSAIAARHREGSVVAGVCTGVMLVAAAGLLRGRPAVTHHAALEALELEGAIVRADARVVDDGELLTAGGVTAAIDLALHLVRRELGAAAALEAARRIEHVPSGPVFEVLGG